MTTAEPTHPPPADTGVVDAENPWPGLAAFREADQEFFHGREREVEEILRLLLRERLTVLFGLSGLGKTSLLQAGLFPRLREENLFPVYIRLDLSEDEGAAPDLVAQTRATIAREAAAAGVEAPPFGASETIWESFHRQGADFWNARNRLVTPLLLFDQFEEVFTLGRRSPAHAQAVEAFLAELVALCEGAPPEAVRARLDENPEEARSFSFSRHPYKILLSLREDFVPDLEGLRGRIRSISQNRFRLRRMTGANALQVVLRPGRHLVEPEVAERIVRFVAGCAEGDETPLAELEVEPALLSVVCRELNNKRRRQGAPKITADLLQGNREEILSDFYERSLADLAGEVGTFIEEKLLTTSGYRDSVALESALESPGVTRKAIEKLTNRRLLRIEDRGGVQRIELTHDVLSGVVRASRDSRRQREAQALAEEARREAEEKERRMRAELRRTRRMSLLYLLLGLVAVTAAVWGWVMRQRAVEAELETRRMVIEAAAQLVDTGNASHALAHFAHSARIHPEAEVIRNWLLNLLLHEGWPVPEVVMAHPKPVLAASFSPDGQLVATGSADGKARIWDARTGHPVGTPLAHAGGVSAAVFSPDGRLLATASDDRTARIWDVRTGHPQVPPLQHEGRVFTARFSPDGRIVASASDDGSARLWETATGRLLHTLPHGARRPVWDLAFSPDGTMLVTGFDDGQARTWDTLSGRPLAAMRHGAPVGAVAFSPDSTQVASGSDNGTARIWNPKTGEPAGPPFLHPSAVVVLRFGPRGRVLATGGSDNKVRLWMADYAQPVGASMDHASSITFLEFDPQNPSRLLTASDDGTARVWHVPTGEPEGEPLHHTGAVVSAHFSPRDSRRVLTASAGGTARLWRIQEKPRDTQVLLRGAPATDVGFSPDGRLLAAASARGEVRLWGVGAGSRARVLLRHEVYVGSIAFSPDGRRLATASHDGTARLWDIATGRPAGEPLRHDSGVQAVAFSPDGRRLATAAQDGAAFLWDAQTLRRTAALRHRGPVQSIAFSPDGRLVLTASRDATAQLWEVPDGRPASPLLRHREPLEFAAFSPDGRTVVTTSMDDTARLWDIASGRNLHVLEHHGEVHHAAFSPDGGRLATASGDNRIIVWDVATGRPIVQTIRHDGAVWFVRFSPDGKRLLSASEDNTVRLWQSATGLPITPPIQHKGGVRKAVFCPRGRSIASASNDGTVRLWQSPTALPESTQALAALAEAVSGWEADAEGTLVPIRDPVAKLREFHAAAAALPERPPWLEGLRRRFPLPETP
jgi:WD40 repeat protein